MPMPRWLDAYAVARMGVGARLVLVLGSSLAPRPTRRPYFVSVGRALSVGAGLCRSVQVVRSHSCCFIATFYTRDNGADAGSLQYTVQHQA